MEKSSRNAFILIDPCFDSSQFLREFWQQKPCLLRGFLPHFVDPIDEHDLAGLAQEDEVDSRIVTRDEHDVWQSHAGPFDDFEDVVQGKWSLLVQGTDRFFPGIDALAQLFNFIPHWRTDDVMVSFSVPGAGVGAHIDQYDVFLIQGKGKRHWRVGKAENQQEFDNNGLRQIKSFSATVDCITEAGDVLYIPPGWPHEGATIEHAMTYSIGFRAPDNELLFGAILDAVVQGQIENTRYSDPHPVYSGLPGEVTAQELQQLKSQMQSVINSDRFNEVLLTALSVQNIEPIVDEEYSSNDIQSAIDNRQTLYRREAVRPIYSENSSDSAFTFFIDGEAFCVPASLKGAIKSLINHAESALQPQINKEDGLAYIEIISSLIERGFYSLNQPMYDTEE
ncbi:cupin domain-containing protein [Alteromonas facilis]|uniref:cupin domain-containing protein n=1 Tax=Alteromonas facilis TaxID=2048004 RepID=UPI000C2868D0|nr:cupin domain-containing protein [Alteromonas facilis]